MCRFNPQKIVLDYVKQITFKSNICTGMINKKNVNSINLFVCTYYLPSSLIILKILQFRAVVMNNIIYDVLGYSIFFIYNFYFFRGLYCVQGWEKPCFFKNKNHGLKKKIINHWFNYFFFTKYMVLIGFYRIL